MPRPKSDLKMIAVKLGDEDRALLDRLAKRYRPPSKTEAVRRAIRAAAETELRPRKKSKKIPR